MQGPPIQTTNLYTQVVNNPDFHPGSITLTATQIAGAGSGTGFNFPVLPKIDSSTTSITLNQAGLYGGAVTLSTSSESLHATTAVNTSTPTSVQTGINFIDNLTILGGLADSTADATIDLGPDSSIVGSSFTAMSLANSDAETKPIAIKLGVAISLDTTSATLTAAGKITTTGDTTLDAGAMNTLSAIANAGGNAAGAGAAVAIGVENSTASSIVTSTAQIRAGGDLTVQANTTNNKALQAVTTTGDNGKIGIGVAIASTNDTTTAQMNGSAQVGGDALIQSSETKNGFNGTKLFFIPNLFTGVAVNTGVGTDDSGDLLTNLQGATTSTVLGKVGSFVTNLLPFLKSKSGPATNIPFNAQATAAVAIDAETNIATASIGPGALIRVAGNLNLDANTNDRPNVLASSGVNQPSSGTGSGGTTSNFDFDGSAALAYGDYTNTATSTISSGAIVDVGKKLAVTSEALNDFQFSYGVNLYTAIAQSPTFNTDQTGASDVTLNPTNIVELGTNFTGTGNVGDWYQYVGAGTLPNVNLTTQNYSNTNLWTDLGPGWEYRGLSFLRNFNTYLDNSFGADNNLFDTWSQATSNNNNTPVAVAGSLTCEILNQTSNASIASGAQINQDNDPTYRTGTQSVFVLASGTNSSLNAGGSVQTPGLSGSNKEFQIGVNAPGTGVQASDASVGAAFVLVLYTDDVTATISSGVKLYADSLDVDAETAVFNFSVMISGGSSSNFGFVGVLSVVDLNDTTLAQIASGTTIDVGSNDVVEPLPTTPANTIPAFTTDAILANELPGKSGTDSSGNPTDTVNASTIVQAHDLLDLFNYAGGIMAGTNSGVGASVGVNTVTRDTEAYIGDPSTSAGNGSVATVHSGGPMIVDAQNNGQVDTGARRLQGRPRLKPRFEWLLWRRHLGRRLLRPGHRHDACLPAQCGGDAPLD